MEFLLALTPIIWFHSKEAYFPASMERMISQAEIWNEDKLVAERVTPETLVNSYNGNNNSFRFKEIFYEGEKKELADVPIYLRIQDFDQKTYRLAFFVVFPYNGDLNIMGGPCCHVWPFKFGSHQGDLERFSLYVNKDTRQIERIYLGAHGSKDGIWKKPEEIEYEEVEINGTIYKKPVFYCAWHSHAFYEKAKTWVRYFGFANDDTNRGTKWSPKPQVVNQGDPIWQNFEGSIGWPDHSNVPQYHISWDYDPDTSTNSWKRFFGCC